LRARAILDQAGTFINRTARRLLSVTTELVQGDPTVPQTSILIVDDEKLLQWSLRERLEEAGYRVLVADSARSVLANPPCGVGLVLLDFERGEAFPPDLVREIRRRCPDCRVIVMTTDPTPEFDRAALEEGAVGVLHKPFDLEEMAQVVQSAFAA